MPVDHVFSAITKTLKIGNIFLSATALIVLALVGISCLPQASQSTPPPSKSVEQTPAPTLLPQPKALDQPGQPPQTGAGEGQQTADQQSIDLQYLIRSDPANVDVSKLPITPVRELHTTGNPSSVDISQYRLTLDGFVDRPLSLSYDDIKALPSRTETVLLICPEFFVDNARWTGVPVAALLASAGIQSRANKITFIALDGYRQTLSREEVQDEGVFLAYSVNGQALPVEQGFPVRLVVRGKYGNIWVKWLQRIEVG